MKDENKTKKQLVSELKELRRRIAGLATQESKPKRMEKALRNAEAKYIPLLAQASAGVVIAQDNVFKFVNKAYADMIGYSVEELSGMAFMDVVPPECRDIIAERYKKRLKSKRATSLYEMKALCKD